MGDLLDNSLGTPAGDDRNDATPLAVDDPDLDPIILGYASGGVDPSREELEIVFDDSANSNIRIWTSARKQSLVTSGTRWEATDPNLPETLFVEGMEFGTETITLNLYTDGAIQPSDSNSILITVATAEFFVYRPQTEGPGYSQPFPQTQVPPAEETVPGVGIRRNGDNDDAPDALTDNSPNDTAISGENDLIETLSLMPPAPGIEYVLSRSNTFITVWANQNKSGGLLELSDPNQGVFSCAGGASACDQWVEWASMNPADTSSTLTLTLRVAADDTPIISDTLVFHPFTSVVIVFGGNTQNPNDTDGDGSIGDPVSGANREGIFDVAQQLYENGWDVHAYDEEVADEPNNDFDESVAFLEVESAIQNRLVTGVGIFGYSQGGGATHGLSEALNAHGINVDFAGFIDAVGHDLSTEQNDYPNGVDYLLNIYQDNGLFELGGGAIAAGTGQGANDVLDQINVTTDTGWDHNLDHSSIDDDTSENDPTGQFPNHVQDELIEALDSQIDR